MEPQRMISRRNIKNQSQLSKLGESADSMIKILTMLFLSALIPGFAAMIIYGITIRSLVIQDLATASSVAITAFACAVLFSCLLIFPLALPAFAAGNESRVRRLSLAVPCSALVSTLIAAIGYWLLTAQQVTIIIPFSLFLFVLSFIGYISVFEPAARRALNFQYYLSLFAPSLGTFLALYILFITLFYLLRNSMSVVVGMFIAAFFMLLWTYYVSADKRNSLRILRAALPLVFLFALLFSINPQTNELILSSIGFRSPGPVEIIVDAKISPIFSTIQGVTTEPRGEFLLITNVGIAFRSNNQIIIEAPYSRFSIPPHPKGFVTIKSEDVKAILQSQPVM